MENFEIFNGNYKQSTEHQKFVSHIKQGIKIEIVTKEDYYKFNLALADIVDNIGDFKLLTPILIQFQAQYKPDEPTFKQIGHYILDCHILNKEYEIFVDKTKNDNSFIGFPNTNIQVYFLASHKPRALDLIRLSTTRKSKFIKTHFAEYLEAAQSVFDDYAEQYGGWKQIMQNYGLFDNVYGNHAFCGLWKNNFVSLLSPSYCLYTSSELNEILKNLQREAESRAREKLGMKRVGEGWVSETLLFHQLKQKFPDTTIIQHGRPSWLKQQHLDIWFPDWAIAVEFHGKQHFQPVEFFGGEKAFQQNKKRDRLKKYRCTRNGVVLLVVQESYDLDELVQKIIELRKTPN